MAGQFAVDLSRLIERAKGKTDLAVKKVMLDAFTGVIVKSPVDTGRFRANWLAGESNYSTETTTDTDKTGQTTVGRITQTVMGMRIDGRSVFLTNSLPYSIRLEYGHSGQAPSGMVRVTLAEISAHYGR